MMRPEGWGDRRLGALVGAGSFGLLALAFPPAGVWPLAFVALAPWIAWIGGRPRRGFRSAFWAGQLLFGTTQLWWISHMSTVGPASYAAWASVMLLWVLFALPLGWLLRIAIVERGLSPLWVLPVVVPAHEFLRETALGGLAWASAGHALGRAPLLIQTAEWGGVTWTAVVVWFVNASLARVLVRALRRRRGERRSLVRPAAAAALAVAMLIGVGALRMANLEGRLRPGPVVVGIQPNVLLEERAEARRLGQDPRMRFFRRRVDLVAAALARRPEAELVIWPESSFFAVDESSSVEERRALGLEATLGARLQGTGSSVAEEFGRAAGLDAAALRSGRGAPRHLLGLTITEDAEPGSPRPRRDSNSALLVEHGGGTLRPLDRYDKRILVPLGEYVPFPRLPGRRALMDFIRDRAGFVPDMEPGRRDALMTLPREDGPDLTFGVTICYEIVFPALFRDAAEQGADFLVNISNDVWYGTSAEMAFVDLQTRFRAVESRRSVVRVGNTGISVLVDPLGRERAAVEVGGRRERVAGSFGGVVPLLDGGGPGPTPLRSAPWLLVAAAAAVLLRVVLVKSSSLNDLGDGD